jgi:hypothetical protein
MAWFFLLCNSLPDFPLAWFNSGLKKIPVDHDSPAAGGSALLQLVARHTSCGIVHSKTEAEGNPRRENTELALR